MHEGAHVFEWLSAILGSGPEEIVGAWSLTTRRGAPAPNIVGAHLLYKYGTVANIEFGWLLEALPTGFIRVAGARDGAERGVENFDLAISTASGATHFSPVCPKMERYFGLVERRIDAPSVSVEMGEDNLVIAGKISV